MTDNQHSLKFDPFSISLNGTHLIEASAGTGKTYGIVSLLIRLIIIEGKTVEEILVVTYTKAAVSELKNRLRNFLNKLFLQLTKSTNSNEDLLYITLVQEIEKNKIPLDEAILRIKKTLNNFDQSSIFTIHGFSHQILKEEAFLSGMPFELELLENNQEKRLEMVADFWREYIINDPNLALLYFTKKLTPEKAFQEIKHYLQKPYIHHINIQENYTNQFSNILKLYKNIPTFLEEISQIFYILQQNKILKNNIFRKSTYEKLFSKIAYLINQNRLDFNDKDIDALTRFEKNTLISHFKKSYSLTKEDEKWIDQVQILYRLGEDAKKLNNESDNALVHLYLKLIHYTDQKIEKEKALSNKRSFDDLLIDVNHVLKYSAHGKKLAKKITNKWKVVLIDEFQDTDPIQYSIFKSIFINNRCPVFLVGDPKQAIYGFRGADIFSYLDAKKDAKDNIYTLDTNYRSHQQLVYGFEFIFSQHPQPFVLEGIHYIKVKANRKNTQLSYVDSQLGKEALALYRLNTEDETSEILYKRSSEACAYLIATHLQEASEDKLKYKNKILEAKDIAILVRTHHEAQLISRTLKKWNIKSVKIEKESIFSTDEAKSSLSLLNYILYPEQPGLLRYLLSSILFQKTGQEIQQITIKEEQQWKQYAVNTLSQWKKYGIYTAFQYFSKVSNLENHLIYQQKERIVTNLNQIFELLAIEESEQLGEESLSYWLEEKIQESEENISSIDEYTLRLESNESLVKIITIHSSKGLQYPIVFAPFIWNYSEKNDLSILNKICIERQNYLLSKNDILQNNHYNQLRLQQTLSERLRLLYVALTRAEEKLILFIKDTPISVNFENNNNIHPLQFLQKNRPTHSTWDAWNDRYRHFHHTEGIKLYHMLPECTYFKIKNITSPTKIIFHDTKKRHYRHYELTSFSKIEKFIHQLNVINSITETQILSIDDIEMEQSIDFQKEYTEKILSEKKEIAILFFPKGANTGLCWHDILEHIDFNKNSKEYLSLIEAKLERYQLSNIWSRTMMQLIENTKNILLDENIKLKDIKSEQKITEMPFLMNFSSIFDLTKINQWIQENISTDYQQPILNQKNRLIIETFLRGFIDLICIDQNNHVYIIDYKSNHLGFSLSDYNPSSITRSMTENLYYLQVTIYTLASYRYFKQRNKKIDMFHLKYIFLRGLISNTHNGIWSCSIHISQIENLERVLQTEKHDISKE